MNGLHPAVARRLGLPPNPTGAPMGNVPDAGIPGPTAPPAFQPALGPPQMQQAPMPPHPNSMGSYAPEPGVPSYGQALNPQMMGQPMMQQLPRLPMLPKPGMVPGA